MFLHAFNGSKSGIKNLMIKSNDTDVVVIATGMFWQLELEELNVTFGRGKDHKIIPIHRISNTLGIEKCTSILLFHSLTGCDSTAALLGVRKPRAWNAWLASSETLFSSLTALTLDLQGNTNFEGNPHYVLAEKFISSIYCPEANTMDEARIALFLQKGTPLMKLPMTSDTFKNKLKRSMYQANIWAQSLAKIINVPEPENWGFRVEDGEIAFDWGTLPDVLSKKWGTFKKCSFKTDCSTNNRCGCHKETENRAELGCTTLCKCSCLNKKC